MRKINLMLLVFPLFALCCNNKNTGSDKSASSVFSGNWISLNYRDSLDRYGTPGKVKNIDLDEIIINFSADSMCLNVEGVETPVFKIVDKKENSFRVNKFNQDDFTEFTISKERKEITYQYKKFNQKFRFFKVESKYAVKVINGWATAAQLYFNERTIASNYYKLNSDGSPISNVAFTSYGKIEGLQAYNEFSICYQGDCRSMSDDDMITLSDGKTSDNFIYEWNNGTLVFYSVSNTALRDEMPHYVKATEIFKFRKKM